MRDKSVVISEATDQLVGFRPDQARVIVEASELEQLRQKAALWDALLGFERDESPYVAPFPIEVDCLEAVLEEVLGEDQPSVFAIGGELFGEAYHAQHLLRRLQHVVQLHLGPPLEDS